jgi:hypothetical protein
MHREFREIHNSDEHSVGPTVDLKPWSWFLFRASYRRFWRNAPGYDPTPENLAKKLDEAKRQRDKSSLFAQVSPWDNLTFHAGFEMISDRFPESALGTQYDFNYSPSAGVIYMPASWLKFFADYNWERFDWRLDAMQRTSTAQNPGPGCTGDCLKRLWTSRGTDLIHTISVGSDVSIIDNVLDLRIQYGFSTAKSEVHASGSNCVGCTPATNYPDISNSWHELLLRLQYRVHKNVALKFGYYFNHATDSDFGVDIMKPWMGDVDSGANVQRSIFLGDKVKGPFTAHVGFVAVRFSF